MAIEPGRMMAVNLATKATITTDAAVQGEHDVNNIVSPNPSKYWRTQDSTTTAVITLDYSTNVLIDSIAICLHNLSIAATVMVELFDNSVLKHSVTIDALTPPYGFGLEPGYGLMGHGGYPLASDDFVHWPNTEIWLDQLYEVDQVKITITDTGNSDNHLMLRYLLVSRSYKPVVNFDRDYSLGFQPRVNKTYRPDGALIIRSDEPSRQAQVNWSWLSKTEVITLNQILLYLQRTNEPIYWSGFPDDDSQWGRQNSMLANIVNWTPPKHIEPQGLCSITFEEVMFRAA